MLHFDKLRKLLPHTQLMETVLPQVPHFFVGGCVRDLLLDIVDEPTDIDLTMAGEPDDIREQMQLDETKFSRFRTEKFGTMSLVTKNSPFRKGGGEAGGFASDITSYQGEPIATYELTPFRAESGYTDFRHPDQIVRSHDMLEDSARRDFSINCLYRTSLPSETLPSGQAPQYCGVGSPPDLVGGRGTKGGLLLHTNGINGPFQSSVKKISDDVELLAFLTKYGGCFDRYTNTIILQSYELIRTYLDIDTNKTQLSNFLTHLPAVWYLPVDSQLQAASTKNHSSLVTCHLSILLDPHRGLNDLVHRTLRCVGEPKKRFSEDALRIVRGLRFVNILNQRLPDIQQQNSSFDIEKHTWKAMQAAAPLVKELASERLHQELVKVFQGPNPFGYIALLRELNLLEMIFPALHRCIGNRQPIRYHPFDTYNHTILTLRHLQQLTSDYLVKLAMLYHDVGKPEQYAFMEKAFAENPDDPDRTGYEHHVDIGVRLAQTDFEKLCFSRKEIEQICRYIRRHHRPGEILNAKEENREKKLRSLLSEGDIQMTLDLLDIAIADRLGQYNPLQVAAIQELEELKQMAKNMYATEGRFTMKELAIDGNDLIQEFALKPGPQIGELLDKAFERVLENVTARNTKKKILMYLGVGKV